MNCILIVSHARDEHAKHLIAKAKVAGLSPILFDLTKFPSSAAITIEVSSVGGHEELVLKSRRTQISKEKLAGVWWRRPQGTFSRLKRTPLTEYVELESETVLRSLNHYFHQANWISDPEATRLACRKPVQLSVAREAGFRIPMTCITNSPCSVQAFIKQLGSKKLAIKPVGSSLVRFSKKNASDKNNKVIFTKAVNPDLILKNLNLVGNCPVIYQEAIEKDSDIRVTVIDNVVYAAEITIEGCADPDNLDWRNYGGTRVYRTHRLPDAVAQLCIDVTKKLGLRFGCIDLGFSHAEGYTFFEINPQGQWLPSEVRLGYDISGALIRALSLTD